MAGSNQLGMTSNDSFAQIRNPKQKNMNKFGYGSFVPEWLQFMNRAPFLLAALSVCALCQGVIVNGFISTSISSIEKRFSLSSTQSGVFSAFYDVAVALVLLPLSHFGYKCHKGRIISIGMVFVGIGSIAITIPHFLAGKYTVGENHSMLCELNGITKECTSDDAPHHHLWYFILLLSQLFIGIGAAPLFTLGISYMDENIKQNEVALYLGIYMAISTVGPAVGFIAGGQMLKIWGDIGKTKYKDLNIKGPSDPRWYGAWWIGFLVIGVLSLISSVPLFGFPKGLPEKEKNRSGDIKQTHKDLDKHFEESIFAYPKVVINLMRNVSFVTLMAMQITESFLMNGFITFIPKVFENLFSYSASQASTITGIIVVPMGMAGSIFGAFLAKKTVNYRPTIILSIAFYIISFFLSFIFLYHCAQPHFAGVSIDYHGSINTKNQLNDMCNNLCHCSTAYNPVCDKEKLVNYYSPCYAGCLSHQYENKNVWTSCSCVAQSNFTNQIPLNETKVEKGLCKVHCPKVLFMTIFACLCFFTFCSMIPIQQASLRLVSFETRDTSICLTWLFMRIFGSIPGAVIFGIAIDRTCVLWRRECNASLSCLRYDIEGLSRVMLLFGLVLKALAALFLSISCYYYKPPLEEEKNEVEAQSDVS